VFGRMVGGVLDCGICCCRFSEDVNFYLGSLVKKIEKCRRLDPLRLYSTTLNEYGIQVYHKVSLKN